MFCKSNCVMFHQYPILRFCFYSPISRQDRRRRHCSSSLTWSSWFDRTELTETDLTEKVLDRNRVDRIHTWVYKKWQVSAGYEISTGSRVINPGRNNKSYLFQVWKAFSIQHIPSSKIVLKSKKFLSCLVSDDSLPSHCLETLKLDRWEILMRWDEMRNTHVHQRDDKIQITILILRRGPWLLKKKI